MTKTIRKNPIWLAAMLLLASGMAFRGGACGPYFPNWLLIEGDQAVLRAPEALFGRELQRMHLVTTTNVARLGESPERDTVEMDLADLRLALEQLRTPAKVIEACVARHREERFQLEHFAAAVASSETNNLLVSNGAAPRVTSGLPPEFADYFRGAIAWHQTNFVAARAAWQALLKRAPAERHHKSTWAAFMLAKSWEEENPAQAIRWYRRVRELARSGFADSLGLDAESLGWEARLEKLQRHYAAAIELYLEQDAAGDPTAKQSLRFVAAEALGHGRGALDSLARNLHAQRVITAYIISGGYRQPEIDVDPAVKEGGMLLWKKAAGKVSMLPAPNLTWHKFRQPAALWLEAVEAANVQDVESAEQLALAAYQAGDTDAARRWLQRARPTLVTQWLQAKLALYDGNVARAEELLAKMARALPASVSDTNDVPPRRLIDSLFVDTGSEFHTTSSPAQAVQGEMAVVNLARRRHVESLDALMHSAPEYWMDVAYVAERVLTMDELKAYIDRHYPAAPPGKAGPTNGAVVPEPAPQFAGGYEGLPREYNGAEGLRYLLARRLARAYRFAEAAAYYPQEWRPLFDQLSACWRTAENISLPQMERGQALIQAAVLSRKYGLELLGTEVEPDWRIHAGNFVEGISVRVRPHLGSSNFLAVSREEVDLASSHGVSPEWRWHYRAVAAVIGWEAAKLLREARSPEQTPAERARELFAEGARLRNGGICCVPFDIEPGLFPRAPEAERNGTLAERVAQTLSRLSASEPEEIILPTRPMSFARLGPEALWECGYTSAALAWDAAQLLPNNSDETARMLCRGGDWIRGDPPAADILYKALVRRCRKTAIGAEADRRRWFPKLDRQGNLVPREQADAPAASEPGP